MNLSVPAFRIRRRRVPVEVAPGPALVVAGTIAASARGIMERVVSPQPTARAPAWSMNVRAAAGIVAFCSAELVLFGCDTELEQAGEFKVCRD
jgi:hypothetical protein